MTASSSCSAASWTADEEITLELPLGVELASTAWSVCYSARGASPTNVVVTLNGPAGTTEQVDIKTGLEEILDQRFAIDHYAELCARLEDAPEILMLGDNAGETVFDRILIEELGKPVRYAVREAPMSFAGSRMTSKMASSITPCTVRSGSSPGGCCFCQPWKCVPS